MLTILGLILFLSLVTTISNHDRWETLNVEAAKELIGRAVIMSPSDSSPWTFYARIEGALKNFARARAMFNRAVVLSPRDW